MLRKKIAERIEALAYRIYTPEPVARIKPVERHPDFTFVPTGSPEPTYEQIVALDQWNQKMREHEARKAAQDDPRGEADSPYSGRQREPQKVTVAATNPPTVWSTWEKGRVYAELFGAYAYEVEVRS